MSEHQRFVELGALYASANISDEQLKLLDEHLGGCPDCRRAVEEFQEVVSMGLPAMAPDFADAYTGRDPEPREERAQRRLLARIEKEIVARRPSPADVLRDPSTSTGKSGGVIPRYAQNMLRYAAAILLIAFIGAYAYYLGARRGSLASDLRLKQIRARAESLEQNTAVLSNERKALLSKLRESDQKIEMLTTAGNERLGEIRSLKKQNTRLIGVATGSEAKRAALEIERTNVNRELAAAQNSLDVAQRALESAHAERASGAMQVAELEKRLTESADGLKERDQTIQQQTDLLAHDRDIRDLISARDLYVAEVNDVDRNAQTKTPFGRVFYTKGKSLIFYAYDLDKQTGLKRAATFQAWGRRGPDFEHALPLGILYLDSASNRRWVLRLDNAKTIAEIDAVFVTIEPKGGSQKPTGQPLLFAYLKVQPNHP
jgi:hypothetical protein